MTYDDFVNEFADLNYTDFDIGKTPNFENASLLKKIKHWASCKREGIECDLSFLNNKFLEQKLESYYQQSKQDGVNFIAFIYANLYDFESCFSTENKGRVNRWNLFETASDLELDNLRNQLKEKDKIIQDLTENKDDFRSLIRGILLDDF